MYAFLRDTRLKKKREVTHSEAGDEGLLEWFLERPGVGAPLQKFSGRPLEPCWVSQMLQQTTNTQLTHTIQLSNTLPFLSHPNLHYIRFDS